MTGVTPDQVRRVEAHAKTVSDTRTRDALWTLLAEVKQLRDQVAAHVDENRILIEERTEDTNQLLAIAHNWRANGDPAAGRCADELLVAFSLKADPA